MELGNRTYEVIFRSHHKGQDPEYSGGEEHGFGVRWIGVHKPAPTMIALAGYFGHIGPCVHLFLMYKMEINNTCLKRLMEDSLRNVCEDGRDSVSDGGYHYLIKSPVLSPRFPAQQYAENHRPRYSRCNNTRRNGKGCEVITQKQEIRH